MISCDELYLDQKTVWFLTIRPIWSRQLGGQRKINKDDCNELSLMSIDEALLQWHSKRFRKVTQADGSLVAKVSAKHDFWVSSYQQWENAYGHGLNIQRRYLHWSRSLSVKCEVSFSSKEDPLKDFRGGSHQCTYQTQNRIVQHLNLAIVLGLKLREEK